MRSTILLFSLVLLGAGCLSSVSLEPTTITTPSPSIEPESEITTYVMSSGIVMFSTPKNWFVRQADGGGFSSITIKASKDDDQGMDISVQTPLDASTGEKMAYEDWIATLDLTDIQGIRSVDGFAFSQHERALNTETVTAYVATIDSERPIYILIQTRNETAEIESVLNSITFFPSSDLQSGAQPIPEWQLADTQE